MLFNIVLLGGEIFQCKEDISVHDNVHSSCILIEVFNRRSEPALMFCNGWNESSKFDSMITYGKSAYFQSRLGD